VQAELDEVDFRIAVQVFLKLTNTDRFAAWFEVTGDATPGGIRVVQSVFGVISSLVPPHSRRLGAPLDSTLNIEVPWYLAREGRDRDARGL